VRIRIPILSFFLLALIFSCKSNAQSNDQSGVPTVFPQEETQIDQSQEPVKIEELADTTDMAEEIPLSSDIDEEDSEETPEESIEEIEQPESESPGSESIEEIPEIPEIEETPIQEETQEPEEQEPSEEMVEESVPLPVEEPPPVEQPPPVIQEPTVQPPPLPPIPPVQPPAQQQPPAQSQVPERTAPRLPPSPPPFLGPAEPEITSPSRQEPVAPALPELPSLPREEPEEQIVFSRVVRLTVGQMLEIPFRGTGWVYLGEMGNRRGLSYDSRRLDTQGGNTLGQSFVFRAEIAGTYILKFYRQDFIQDYIINDYVQVIVSDADDFGRGRPSSAIDRGRVIAEPRWPVVPETAGSTSETVPPATEATAGTQRPDTAQVAAPTSPAISDSAPATAAPSQTGALIPANATPSATSAGQAGASDSLSPGTSAERAGASDGSPPDEYVRQAKQEFDAGHVEQALAILDQMKQRYPPGTDEAWWLLGQLYEANSSARDIKQSLECYRTLVNEFPQSNRVDDARRRIAYLERYYLNIR